MNETTSYYIVELGGTSERFGTLEEAKAGVQKAREGYPDIVTMLDSDRKWWQSKAESATITEVIETRREIDV